MIVLLNVIDSECVAISGIVNDCLTLIIPWIVRIREGVGDILIEDNGISEGVV
jgi:hypothetical protein